MKMKIFKNSRVVFSALHTYNFSQVLVLRTAKPSFWILYVQFTAFQCFCFDNSVRLYEHARIEIVDQSTSVFRYIFKFVRCHSFCLSFFLIVIHISWKVELFAHSREMNNIKEMRVTSRNFSEILANGKNQKKN